MCVYKEHILLHTLKKNIPPPRHIILKFQKTEDAQKFNMLPEVKIGYIQM